MMKFVGYMCLIMVAIVVLGGCSAHEAATANTAASATASADWRAALDDTGVCSRKQNVTQDAYIECLQKIAERDRSNAEAMAKRLAEADKTAPAGTRPGPDTGLVPQAPQAPEHARPTYQQYLDIPAAAGPLCDSPKELTLTVTNTTPYLIEVNGGGKLAPYNCDAQQNLAYFDVVKADGTPARILAIPPAIDGRPATARFVFLPLNGGMGDLYKGSAPEVNFLRYEFQHSNNPMHPIASPYAGLPVISKHYQVPFADGNWIKIL